MARVNSQYFDKEQIEAGELKTLLDYLMTEAYGKGQYYNDIHIKPADLGAFIVEWVQVPWSHEFGGHFEYLEEDEQIFKEIHLPDNTYQYILADEDENEFLDEWLKDNPGWVKNDYGMWTNELENEKFREELEKEKEENTKSSKKASQKEKEEFFEEK